MADGTTTYGDVAPRSTAYVPAAKRSAVKKTRVLTAPAEPAIARKPAKRGML